MSCRATHARFGRVFARIALLFVVCLFAPDPAGAQSDPVRPILECVEDLGGGSFRAHFGYLNENAVDVTIPIGSDNKFTPSPQDRGQPTVFTPGRTPFFPDSEFQVDFDGSPLVWSLDGRTSTASNNPAQRCAVCGNGQLEGNEGCDDGGNTDGDGCDANCNLEPGYACTGSPSVCSEICGDAILTPSEDCDDGNVTVGDGCDDLCRLEPACPAEPALECRSAARTKLLIRRRDGDPEKSRVVFMWRNGEATSPTDFGDPELTTAYRMCVWDHPAGLPEVATDAHVQPGGGCGGSNCWVGVGNGSGFAYRDPTAANDGVFRLDLRARAQRDDRGLVRVLAVGEHVQMPADLLPLSGPVVVQVHSSAGECWEGRYVSARKNDSKLYRAVER